jgi:hypothetical protein
MSDANLPVERPRRFHFDWVWPALSGPRAFLRKLVEVEPSVWLTPVLVLVLVIALRVVAQGQATARQNELTGGPVPPEESQFWTPEQFEAWNQSVQMLNGPVFLYGFPLLGGALGVIIGWVLTFAILHLVLTLLGGRGTLRVMMNVTAWALLPFAIRELVRGIWMFYSGTPLQDVGLSGFASSDGSGVSNYLSAALSLVDLYLIWHVAMLIIGSHAAVRLPAGQIWIGVLITILVVVGLQALPGFLQAQLNGFEFVRMF